MNKDGAIDEDFAGLPSPVQAAIEGAAGIGLHHAPDRDRSDEAIAAEAADEGEGRFEHHEVDRAGIEWAPNWEPMETYPGGIVMLDNGERQIVAARHNGVWHEYVDDAVVPLSGYRPMLWSTAPDRVKRDTMAPLP